MDYKFYFFLLVAFIVGRISANFKAYIGTDREKYKNATIGILLREKESAVEDRQAKLCGNYYCDWESEPCKDWATCKDYTPAT